jgi:hypothetical protein
LSKWFGWQNAFSDIYVTNPPLGKMKNDCGDLSGLPGAQQRAGEYCRGLGTHLRETCEHLARFFRTLLGERPVRVRRTIGVLAIHRDTVTDEIDEHCCCRSSLLPCPGACRQNNAGLRIPALSQATRRPSRTIANRAPPESIRISSARNSPAPSPAVILRALVAALTSIAMLPDPPRPELGVTTLSAWRRA